MTATEAFEFVPSFLAMLLTLVGVYIALMRAGINKIEVSNTQTALIGKGWEAERTERTGYAAKYEAALKQIGEMQSQLGKLSEQVLHIPAMESQIDELRKQLSSMQDLLALEQGKRIDAENEVTRLKGEVERLKNQVEMYQKGQSDG